MLSRILIIALMSTTIAQNAVADTPLIPRRVLFGNPERAQLRISPDGRYLSFLAERDGVMNVYVAPAGDLAAARPVTADKSRGITQHFWTYTPDCLIYLQDNGGDENFQAMLVNVATGNVTNLTNNAAVATRIFGASHRKPETILLGFNDRQPQFHDVWAVNLRTGEKTLALENPGVIEQNPVAGFVFDNDLSPRLALCMTMAGSQMLYTPDGNGGWTKFEEIPNEDTLTTGPVGFDDSGETLYMIDSRGRDTAALVARNVRTGEAKVLAADERCDVGNIVAEPKTGRPQAVAFNYDRSRYVILDDSIKPDFETLAKVDAGDFEVTSRTLDDSKWTVAYVGDTGPVVYYVYDRASKSATKMFVSQPELASQPLAKMHPRIITARDGLKLVCYLTLPIDSDPDGDGKPNRPLPTVLNVHGGPWARDEWGYNPEHQWLANRGYAVLSVNYRGSTGFGKSFINAANREWAGKMHDDLIDCVNWLVAEGIADKEKIAIYGGSYGGYAALVGVTFTPDVFAAAVSVVGPSNLNTLLETIPPYWAPMVSLFHTRVGENITEEGRAFLLSRSPISRVDAIKKPLLIGQGANDPRVKQAESDQIVEAMKSKNIPVTYVLYPDEGHGFQRPENRMSFYAVTELFLARHLGGRSQEIGDDFKGSSITVPTDTANLPGLDSTKSN